MIRMRYDFVSYSQHYLDQSVCLTCCLWYVWDTILSAIHNAVRPLSVSTIVVYDTYEIRFCQLFTTWCRWCWAVWWLFMIRMRYDFVSYSQHSSSRRYTHWCCLWYVWDTILSAIHNGNNAMSSLARLFMIRMRYDFVSYSQRTQPSRLSQKVVYDTYEIRFCQLFTTKMDMVLHFLALFMIRMRYDFVSYSQQNLR